MLGSLLGIQLDVSVYNDKAKMITAFVVIVVLGSHIGELLNDRIYTAIDTAHLYDNIEVKWFLTGGVKNSIENTIQIDEASQMTSMMDIQPNWSFEIDSTATNTAENFVNFDRWVQSLDQKPLEIIVVTSAFHKKRAAKMFKLINDELDITWKLGSATCPYCANDEIVHMKNVPNDIQKALSK